jgi:REase_DpnII-MboI
VSIIENGLEVIRRMRGDGNAGRGRGTKLVVFNEYDVQNLTELLLSPLVSLQREPFVIESHGISRRADFSFASGRLILELKMSRNSGELARATKDAKGVLISYLDNPGVEIALAVLAVTPGFDVDKNAIEAWTEIRDDRRAIMRVVVVPEVVLTSDKP